MKVLITGVCGFIGSNFCKFLLEVEKDCEIFGIDNFSGNYSRDFKEENLRSLESFSNFHFFEEDVLLSTRILEVKPDYIYHFAGTPGVRRSLQDPISYLKNNIEAFVHLLEMAKQANVKRIVYASSSSVYGNNKKTPFSEVDPINSLQSSYAITKHCMEIYAKYYNELFNLPCIGLRFFTVYGNQGRPDMAPYMFLKAIHEGSEIKKYGDGSSMRDYTHISDIIQALYSLYQGKGNPGIYNIGSHNPISLSDFIALCESIVEKPAKVIQCPPQLGDVNATFADISKARLELDYIPKVTLINGLSSLYSWMKSAGRITDT